MMLPPAIIIDLNGTLGCIPARFTGAGRPRTQADWHAYFTTQEFPCPWAVHLCQLYAAADYDIICVTGRPESYWQLTDEWFTRNDIPVHHSVMRQEGDRRPERLLGSDCEPSLPLPCHARLVLIRRRTRVEYAP